MKKKSDVFKWNILKIYGIVTAIIMYVVIAVIPPQTSLAMGNYSSAKKEEIVAGENIYAAVSYGFDCCARSDRYNTFTARINNSGEEFFGKVQYIVNSYAIDNVMYQKKITIDNNSTETVNIAIPLNVSNDKVLFRIVDDNDKTIVEKEIILTVNYSSGVAFTGVITENSTDLLYMDSEESKLFYLDKSMLPDDHNGLDALDIIIIDKDYISQLSKKQLEEIGEWVKEGGSFVLGAGEQEYEGAYELLENEFLVSKEDMYETKIHIENVEKKNNAYIQKNIEHMNSDNMNIGFVYAQSDTEITKRSIDFEKGNIQVFETEINVPFNKVERVGGKIRNNIIDSLSLERSKRIKNEYSGYYSPSIFSGLGNGGDSTPSVLGYGILLSIYIAIIGPVLYILLKKKDKRGHIWFYIPLCSLLFTIIIYCAGSKTRVKEPYAGYFSTIFLTDNYDWEEAVFSITSPYKKSCFLNLNKNHNISVSENYNKKYNMINNTYYDTLIESDEENMQIEMINNGVFKPTYFDSKTRIDEKGNIDAQISVKNYKLTGNVTNNFDYDIKNASVLSGGMLMYIGDIKKGETVFADDKISYRMNSGECIYLGTILNDITGYSERKSSFESMRMYSLICYYLEQKLIYNDNFSYVIGFTDCTSSGSVINEIGYNAYGTNMVIQQFDNDFTDEEGIWIPSIDIYCEDINELNRYMEGENAVYEYTFNSEEKIKSIEYSSELNSEVGYKNSFSYDGKICFYNNNTGEYDLIFDSITKGSISELAPYIDENNKLIIKYTSYNAEDINAHMLPYLSAIKEEN